MPLRSILTFWRVFHNHEPAEKQERLSWNTTTSIALQEAVMEALDGTSLP
jgi:hypothetical protein